MQKNREKKIQEVPLYSGPVKMLVTPPFGASSNIALWRAYSKPPVELVVADLEVGFLYFGAIEDKDKQLSGFLEVLVSYHGISKLTIAKMADVEEQDIDRLLANPPEKVEIEVKYKIAVTVMELRFWLKDCELPI